MQKQYVPEESPQHWNNETIHYRSPGKAIGLFALSLLITAVPVFLIFRLLALFAFPHYIFFWVMQFMLILCTIPLGMCSYRFGRLLSTDPLVSASEHTDTDNGGRPWNPISCLYTP